MYHGADGRLIHIWHICEEHMPDLSQHPLPRPLEEDTSRPTKSAAFFLPWLHLSTSHGDGPHEFDFDPCAAIHFNAGISVVTLVLVLLLAGWGYSLAALSWQ
jgi:hypothetical protein